VSRRGLRPRSQAPAPRADGTGRPIAARPLDRVMAPLPAFVAAAGATPSVRGWLHALRIRIREVESQGDSWHTGFDELRDVVWRAWPLLAAHEQRRFLRSLRTWYDAHRFRAPPQNEAIVRAAEADGRVRHVAARLRAVEARDDGTLQVRLAHRGEREERVEPFDAIVNCTGLDAASALERDPLLSSLVDQGRLRIDPAGIGVAVDGHCRAIGADGAAQPALRVIGPPTAGTFGDPLGALFIAAQIHRILPDLLATVASSRQAEPLSG
jgi:uncharacterized NAD(P)/FAD-binding protein YdhS